MKGNNNNGTGDGNGDKTPQITPTQASNFNQTKPTTGGDGQQSQGDGTGSKKVYDMNNFVDDSEKGFFDLSLIIPSLFDGADIVEGIAQAWRYAVKGISKTVTKNIAKEGILNVEQRTLQHMFSQHAKDFGVTKNWSKSAATEFENVLRTQIKELTPIKGTFRGTQQVLHYFNPSTGLDIMTDMSGNLVGGWKLSTDQIKYLLSTGGLK